MYRSIVLGCLVLAALVGIPQNSAAQDGEELYTAFCESCHGPQGLGGLVGRPLQGATPCSIEEAIGRFILGMEFLSFLSTAEIEAISDYLNSFSIDGEDLYVVTCLGCHGKEGEGGRVAERVQGEDADDIFRAMREEEAMRFLRSCATQPMLFDIAQYLDSVD